jgi:hypothetical protein
MLIYHRYKPIDLNYKTGSCASFDGATGISDYIVSNGRATGE